MTPLVCKAPFVKAIFVHYHLLYSVVHCPALSDPYVALGGSGRPSGEFLTLCGQTFSLAKTRRITLHLEERKKLQGVD